MHVETAAGVLARQIRAQADRRFDACSSRDDLRACARLLALAAYLEGEPETAGVFAFLTPSAASRGYPSSDFDALVAQWADDPPECDLATFVGCLVAVELQAALEAELPELR